MADPRSLIRRTVVGTAWSFAGTQGTAVVSLATSIVVARLLVPDELGLYALVTAVVTLLASASSLQSGGYYIVAAEPTPRLLRVGLLLELCLSGGLWVVLSGSVLLYAVVSGDWDVAALFIFAGTSLLVTPFADLSAKYQRELDYRLPTVAQVVTVAVGAAAKIALVLAGFGVWGLVAGDIALTVSYAAIMLFAVPTARLPAFDRVLAGKQLRFGLPLLASGFLNMLTQRLPDLLVGSLIGTGPLGLLYVAERIPSQTYQLGKSISLALLPAFSRSTNRQLQRGFEATLRLSAYLVGLPLAVILVLGSSVTVLLYGERWRSAGPVMALLLAAMAIRFVFWHVANLLKSRGRVKEMTILNTVQVGLFVVACAAAAVLSGVKGVAVAVLAVEVALIIPRLWLIRSVVPFAIGRTFGGPLAALALGSGAALLCRGAFSGFPAIAAAFVLASVIYGLVIWVSEPELRSWLRARRSRGLSYAPRVLVVSRFVPPAYSGAGLQAYRLAQKLASRGARIAVFGSKEGGLPSRQRTDGIDCIRWPVFGKGRASRIGFATALAVHLVCRPGRYDVVHVHGSAFILRVLRPLRSLGFRVVFKSTMFGKDDPRSIADAYGGRTLKGVDSWACISEAIAEAAHEVGVPADRILRIPNGVDLEVFGPRPGDRDAIRGRELIPADETLWLTVGGFTPRKRLDLLIEAWALLPAPRPTLGIVAPMEGAANDLDRDYLERIRREVDVRRLGDVVRFLGRRDDVADLLACADGFVLSTTQEGLPNSVLEALASGLRVVVTDFVGVSDLVAVGGDQLTVAEASPAALAQEISRTRPFVGRPASREEFDLGRIAERYLLLYSQLGREGTPMRGETAYA